MNIVADKSCFHILLYFLESRIKVLLCENLYFLFTSDRSPMRCTSESYLSRIIFIPFLYGKINVRLTLFILFYF